MLGVPGSRTERSAQASAATSASWRAPGGAAPGIGADLRQLARAIAHEVFRHRVGKQPGDEILRDPAVLAAQDFRGCGDERLLGALFIGAGKSGGCHAFPSACRWLAP